MSDEIQVRVPDIGDFTDVDVIEVLVQAGDRLVPEDPLITLETDKAAMDVPAPVAGTVKQVQVSAGDKVSEGDVILTLSVDEKTGDVAPAASTEPRSPERAEPQAEAGERAQRESTEKPRAAKEAAGKGDRAPLEIDVRVPDLGDFSDVDVIEVMVEAGAEIAKEDPLITLETDKAAMDVPAPQAGKVTAVLIKVGDRVSEGDTILSLQVSGDASAEPAEEAPAPQAPTPPEPEPRRRSAPPEPRGELPPIDEASFARAHAGPSVRKLARELGVDLGSVRGSGVKGRITHHDVKAFVKSVMTGALAPAAALPSVPEVDFSKYGEIEMRPLGRIQKISGSRLQASWVNLPHVTQHDEADITELEVKRKALKPAAEARGGKLTPLAFVMRASALALEEFPTFKASLDASGKNLVFKKYTHIGFAADTPQGLLVPVIRDVDQKDLLDLARELAELSGKAREGKLKVDEMQGGCFTISSLGSLGGTAFTPIINAPEVAILGVSRARTMPVFRDGEFVPRLMLPLSLSYDHRVIDGAAAVRFTVRVAELLGAVEPLLPEGEAE